MKETLIKGLPGLGLTLPEETCDTLCAFGEAVVEQNKVMNLTAITDPEAVAKLHLLDSLTVLKAVDLKGTRLIDVGCGAGFPCLPLALVRPDLSITALDSTEKRVRYVADTAKALSIPGLSTLAARAEDAARTGSDLREHFDVATGRAVAPLRLLAELCLPFVRVGGTFIAMKAKKGEEELSEAENAIKRLGGELAALHRIELCCGEERETRYIIEITKKKPTPADLPRPWARMLKKPL